MKYIYIIAILIITLLSSCSTMEKCTVYGTPGTKIYTPNKTELATIPQSGKTSIKLNSGSYYGFLLTKDEATKSWVPFALDVKKKKHYGTKFASGLGYTLTGIGLIASLTGATAGLINSDSSIAGPAACGGLGILAIGMPMGIVASNRMGQLCYQYNFGYHKHQHTNSDLKFTNYIKPQYDEPIKENSLRRNKAKSGSSKSNQEEVGNNQQISKAKSRKSPALQVIGEYTGSGTLSNGYDTPEKLGSIKIVIIQNLRFKDTVKVDIYEDGELFFETEELYKVTKKPNNKYVLTHTNIPSAIFEITNNGTFSFTHPKVFIDDANYTLSIKGKKMTK